MTLTLRSPAFESGAAIPARFDHEHGDLSPALTWDGVPEGTAALVLLVDDPDAPAGLGDGAALLRGRRRGRDRAHPRRGAADRNLPALA